MSSSSPSQSSSTPAPPSSKADSHIPSSSSSATSSAASTSTPPPSFPLSAFHTSQRVQVDHARGPKGTIRYIGPLHTHPPSLPFVGLEYDPPAQGKHDGTHAGRSYFSAPPLTSVFVRHERLLPGRGFDDALKEKYEAANAVGEDEEKLSLTAVNEGGRGKGGRRQFDVEVQFVGLSSVAKKIASGLSSMQYAAVVDMQVSHAGDARTIATKIPNVIDVDLSNNLLGDWSEVADIVRALPQLRALALSQNAMPPFPSSPSSLPSAFSSLRALVLNAVPTAWSSVLQLAAAGHLPVLSELRVAHNAISSLSGSTAVEAKESAGPLTASTASLIARSFPALTTLDLSHNAFTSWEEVCALQRLPLLHTLLLNHNQLTVVFHSSTSPSSSSAPSSSAPFHAVSALSLSDNALSSFDSLSALSRFPALTALSIQRNPPLDVLATTPALLRLHAISRVPSLALLNASSITRRERSDAEKFYMAYAEEQWRQRGEADHARPIGAMFERYEEVRRKHGLVAEDQQGGGGQGVSAGGKEDAGAGTLGRNTAEVQLRLYGKDGQPVSSVSKRVLLSMKVSALRALLDRHFKATVAADRPAYCLDCLVEEGSGSWEAMDDPLKQLSYYGLQEGSIVALRPKR